MKKAILILTVLLTLLTGCASVKKETLTFNGMIYNANNEPVPDVSIYMDEKEIAVTDLYGHFTIYGLKNNTNYKLKAVKSDYETTNFSFVFSNASQVIYIRMYSNSELLSKAEKLLSDKKYAEAKEVIQRAEIAGASYLSLNYLKAVYHYNKKEFSEALSITDEILQNEFDESYVYLLRADIYQYGLNDIENTKENLILFLNNEYSEEIEYRLTNLQNN